MKILFMFMLCAVVAAVYCEHSEKVTPNNCIGIDHVIPNKIGPQGNKIYGRHTLHQICCDQGFAPNTQITGFSRNMRGDDISGVLTANYDRLTKRRTNFVKGLKGDLN